MAGKVRIWVDADHCPEDVRKIIVRAAVRTGRKAFFVSNNPISLQPSPYLKQIRVPGSSQAADRHISTNAKSDDIAVTADIPLAADLVSKGLAVIHPKGDFFNGENIRERLSLRNFAGSLREMGIKTRDLSHRRRKGERDFARLFDRELTKACGKEAEEP